MTSTDNLPRVPLDQRDSLVNITSAPGIGMSLVLTVLFVTVVLVVGAEVVKRFLPREADQNVATSPRPLDRIASIVDAFRISKRAEAKTAWQSLDTDISACLTGMTSVRDDLLHIEQVLQSLPTSTDGQRVASDPLLVDDFLILRDTQRPTVSDANKVLAELEATKRTTQAALDQQVVTLPDRKLLLLAEKYTAVIPTSIIEITTLRRSADNLVTQLRQKTPGQKTLATAIEELEYTNLAELSRHEQHSEIQSAEVACRVATSTNISVLRDLATTMQDLLVDDTGRQIAGQAELVDEFLALRTLTQLQVDSAERAWNQRLELYKSLEFAVDQPTASSLVTDFKSLKRITRRMRYDEITLLKIRGSLRELVRKARDLPIGPVQLANAVRVRTQKNTSP